MNRLRWFQTHYVRLDQTTQGLLSHLHQAWVNFHQRDTHQAASLAYYAALSVFPLFVLAVAVLNFLLGPETARQPVLWLIRQFLPGDTQELIASHITFTLEQGPPLSLMAVVGLFWAASSLFSNLSTVLDRIFHPQESARPMWRKRMLAFGMIVVLALLLGCSLATTFALRVVGTALLERPSVIMRTASTLIPLVLDLAILILLFRHAPPVTIRWKAIGIAAVLGGVGWELSKRLFVWYLDNVANLNLVYGSLGIVIAFLIWAYLSAAILLFSAEVCVALDRWLAQRDELLEK